MEKKVIFMELKEKLKKRKKVFGCWTSTGNESVVEMFLYSKFDSGTTGEFTWKPKFSNYVLHHSGRYARNGNALGFLDPLEALAGMYYDNVTDKMANYALGDTYNNIELINDINSWYYQEVVGDWLLNAAWMYHQQLVKETQPEIIGLESDDTHIFHQAISVAIRDAINMIQQMEALGYFEDEEWVQRRCLLQFQ